MKSVILTMALTSTLQTINIEVPIISSQPIIVRETKLVSKPICREIIQQPTYNNSQSNLGGSIIGGIVGSMIGKNESTRRLMTGVGVVVGNEIANRNQNNPSVNHRTHCYSSWNNEVVEVISGYKVVYELNGKHYQTTIDYKPSHTITIQKQNRKRWYWD